MENTRYDYSPIISRKPFKLPNNARVAVWVIINVEYFDIGATEGGGKKFAPDIIHYSTRDYGPRVGIWRLMELLDRYNIKATVSLNSDVCKHYPIIDEEGKKRGWEFMGHGYTQKSMQKVENEAEDIRKTTEAIARATGKPPRGWLGPGLTETWHTPDLLVEHGYRYVCDWVLDDQPVVLKTRTKPIVNLPYTQECNDVAMMLIQHHQGMEYYQRASDQFDQLYEDSKDSARVMALVVHPYIMGVPHRLKYYRMILEKVRARRDVLFWTGEQILDWYLAQRPDALK